MTAVIPLAPPEVREQATSLITLARQLTITDQATLDLANEYLAIEAALRKKIELHHAPMKTAAWEAHRAACDAEKRALAENCGPIRAILTPKVTGYLAEQRRLAAEEQRRLQEEANRQAEEQRLAEAALLEEQGVSQEDVTAVLNAPIQAPYVPPPPAPKLTGGVSERWEYSARVVNVMDLLKAVVAGAVPLNAIEPSVKYLNGRARSDKENFAIPGCQLVKEPDITVRRR